MTPYTAFYDDVMPELPGAETPLVLHHIKRTCNDWYERTTYMREDVFKTTTVNVPTYTVAPQDTANFETGKVITVAYLRNGTDYAELGGKTPAWLTANQSGWDTRQGRVTYFTQPAIDQVRLAMIPGESITNGLRITIAKLPLYGGAGIDDAVWEKFSETIAAGVKYRLMSMRRKPWTDPVRAAECRQMYESDLAAAAAIIASGFGRAPMRSKPSP